MKPGYTVEQSYQDLLERAEAYFKKLLHKDDEDSPPGVNAWLRDLANVRTQELMENLIPPDRHGRSDIDELDVPL